MNTADCNIRTNATVVSPGTDYELNSWPKTVGLIVSSNVRNFILQSTEINPYDLDPSWPALSPQGFVFVCVVSLDD